MNKNKFNIFAKRKTLLGSFLGGAVVLSSMFAINKNADEPNKEVQSIEEFYASKEDEKEFNEVLQSKKNTDNKKEENEREIEEVDKDIDERIMNIKEIEKSTVYINKKNPEVYELLDDEELKEINMEIFEDIEIIGENKRYFKANKDDKVILIRKLDTSKNRNNIFRKVEDEKRYLNKDTLLYIQPNKEAKTIEAKINEELDLLGFNEKGFARVEYKGDIVYAETSDLSEEKIGLNEIETQIEDIQAQVENNQTTTTASNTNNASTNTSKPKVVRKVKKVPKKKTNTVPKKPTKNATNQNVRELGDTFNCSFSAYYPENSRLQGGFYDAMGNKLVPANNTCAAPPEIPFGTKLLVQGTGTDKDGKVFTVTDRGGAIKMRPDGTWRVDILTSGYNEAYGFGRRNGTVTIVK